MQDSLDAYGQGRADGLESRRDQARATDHRTGADYRVGFLDGRLELFRMHAQVRKILEDG
jgi:hypothetical protein